MARRIATGRVGRSVLGAITALDNKLQSVLTNENIVLEPNGSGIIEAASDLTLNDQSELKFGDTTAPSNVYVGLQAPATVSSSVTFTLPDAYPGGNGYVLKSQTDGTMSWSATSLTVTNRTVADNNEYFITMSDGTTGTEDTLSVADGNRLKFVPNPGLLTVNSVLINSSTASSSTSTGALRVTGGAGIGGALYANSISATSITETSSIAYKENVNPITGALDTILQLAGVTYDRKDGSKSNEAGLIAEDTAKVLPNVVTFKNGKPEGINYTKLSAYLIEAVKELKEELDKRK